MKLQVNFKTKIVIFSKEPAPKHTFEFNAEIVKELNYLGILF